MKTNTQLISFKAAVFTAILAGFLAGMENGVAAPTPDPALAQQLSDAQTKAAQLQGALAQNAPRTAASPGSSSMPGMAAPAPSAMPGMGSAAGAMTPGGMGMMHKNMGDDQMQTMRKMMGMMQNMMDVTGMSTSGAPMTDSQGPGMSGMGGMMGMDKMEMEGMMGSMPDQSTMAPSALPGFPGASHLYHIGTTDFFLDHSSHITLSTDQQVALSKLREQATLAKSASDRKIEQAEQELWMLTAADKPDISKIETKVREIEKLSGDARIAFIRSVGEAARELTDEQRRVLTGFASPAPVGTMNAPATATSSPTPMGMSDM